MDENRPKRKSTRLPNYSYSNVGYYFITICAKNKEKLFGTVVGGGALDAPYVALTECGKIVEQYVGSTDKIQGIQVDKYVIMPNHLHMILIIHEESEKQARANERIPHAVGTMKRLVNRDFGRNVFQRGYHDHVIRGEKDYQKIWSYIEDNPRRWKDDCFYVE
ncbi:MAG: transposase [Oscillospiraceae bacterium]|nr:transposase [Oscillospiraceae bacterium]